MLEITVNTYSIGENDRIYQPFVGAVLNPLFRIHLF